MANKYSDHHELIRALTNKGVSSDQYIIEVSNKDVHGDEQFVLKKSEHLWLVYYEERAEKKRICSFDDFSNAADYLFWKLTRAPGFIEASKAIL